jgi:methylmalonyl-CoA mutase N-terminal domain/subunit
LPSISRRRWAWILIAPRAKGEAGKVGVSVASLRDREILLEDIPLDRVSISMTINSTAAILLCMVLCIARRAAIPWDSLRGTIQNDILKEVIARGTYISMRGHK